MANQIASNGGRAPAVSDTLVVALYHPDSGRIAHLHTVTVFEGGRAVTEKEAVDAARSHAARAGHPADRLKAKVSRDPAHGRGRHRIDPGSGAFVAAPATPRRKASGPK
jgi:hypothetical protein